MLCPMKPIGSDCPNDYIKIYDGKDENSPVIGTFCGVGKFPYSIIGTGTCCPRFCYSYTHIQVFRKK